MILRGSTTFTPSHVQRTLMIANVATEIGGFGVNSARYFETEEWPPTKAAFRPRTAPADRAAARARDGAGLQIHVLLIPYVGAV